MTLEDFINDMFLSLLLMGGVVLVMALIYGIPYAITHYITNNEDTAKLAGSIALSVMCVACVFSLVFMVRGDNAKSFDNWPEGVKPPCEVPFEPTPGVVYDFSKGCVP